MIKQYEITLKNYGRGFHIITDEILNKIDDLPDIGIMNVFLKHTSAGLTINENADPSVRVDFENFMNKLIPETGFDYTHIYEGADDMPAHLKSSLIGISINIPITNHRLNLGTWQGIYLCEFRNFAGSRKIIITVYS